MYSGVFKRASHPASILPLHPQVSPQAADRPSPEIGPSHFGLIASPVDFGQFDMMQADWSLLIIANRS
jgi:hypothetical protein